MNHEELDKPAEPSSNPATASEGTQAVPRSVALPVPAPPPPPKSIFDEIYETTDVNAPKQRIREDISQFIKDSGLDYTYDFVFLYDESGSISRFTSNRLYSAVTDHSHAPGKPLFLLLHTNGGRVEPAYLISKCCKKSAPKFVVAVPRFAKSAGTLLALGADEIHMGIISELGPIDPQIGEYPALGLGSAVEHIATLCKKHPDAVEMLAKYLASNLNLHDLGYFERVSESAVQYADRLLVGKKLPPGQTAAGIAQRFVYGYKDHGFVIDRDEALEILGPEIVKSDSSEYKLANRIQEYLDSASLAYRVFQNHSCKILGDLNQGIIVTKNT
jgi:Serine dehydrogenase proteinase